MNTIKNDILNCLNPIKGSGKFVTTAVTDFIFPGLEITGVGEVAYPINETQAKTLIQAAHKAPFGKGTETIWDDTVRSAWEIDADKLTFNGQRWGDLIEKILQEIKPELGIEDYSISAQLYKMLIYEKGDFFLRHKDSEKEKGMFGTLIIGLPSKHTGGELVVSFDGKVETIRFAEDTANYKIPYTAFYADCDHELKPVSAGYRICLVYNLIQLKAGEKMQAASLQAHVDKLVAILKEENNLQSTAPSIVLLGHQYTPENFSVDALKLNDRHKAEILLRAARQAGYYTKMCLVTSYLSGQPASGGGYYDDDYDDDVDEDAEMEEVYDDWLRIEHWADEETPPLRNITFAEEDLITSFELNDGDPIEKEATGYMGNYGPDLMHWYHYGAVMLWPKNAHFQLLSGQDNFNKLEWLNYYSGRYPLLDKKELAGVETLLSTIRLENDYSGGYPFYHAIVEWVLNSRNFNFFYGLELEPLQLLFKETYTANWVELAQAFPVENCEKLFDRVTTNVDLDVLGQLLRIIKALSPTATFHPLIGKQIAALPQYISKPGITVNNEVLRNLFILEKQFPQNESWMNEMCETLTLNRTRTYIHKVLAPEILALKDKTLFSRKIQSNVQEYLQQQANNKPQAPADWKRPVPETSSYKTQWAMLKAFLESPTEQVFEYRKNQNERTELENAIRNVEIDLKTETIKKGSPHTLRITKTQAAYQKELKHWHEDVELLERL